VSVNAWSGGFVATVKITAGASEISGWNVGLNLPSDATITSSWNANRTGTSGAVQFSNVSYNGKVAAGQATEFGFQATGTSGSMTPTCSST
jgi:cellulase/cellobiase CelA1